MRSINRWGFITIALVLIGTLFFSQGAWSSDLRTRQSNEPRVGNETQALELVSVEERQGDIRLLLRNISNKNINAVAVAVTQEFRIIKDLAIGGRVIASGERYEFFVPRQPQAVTQEQNLALLSVVFEDNTTDGDLRVAEGITYRRLGWKIEMAGILPLLESAVNSSDPGMPATLERVKNQIWSLPEEVSNGPFSWAVKFGFHYAKEDVIDDIEKLESRDRLRKHINLKRELIKMKERLQDRSANL